MSVSLDAASKCGMTRWPAQRVEYIAAKAQSPSGLWEKAVRKMTERDE